MKKKRLYLTIIVIVAVILIAVVALSLSSQSNGNTKTSETVDSETEITTASETVDIETENSESDTTITSETEDSESDTAVTSESDNSDLDSSASLSLEVSMIQGIVVSISEENNRILINADGDTDGDTYLSMDDDVVIYANRSRAAISEIQEGQTVVAIYSGEISESYPGIAEDVSVVLAYDSDADQTSVSEADDIAILSSGAPTIQGSIVNIYEESSRILINADGDADGDTYLSVNDDVILFVDGSIAEISDLQEGQAVAAIYSGEISESYPCTAEDVSVVIAVNDGES